MDKPFKTYGELIRLMAARGLDTGPKAMFILEHEGYYPVVNGYKDLFLAGQSIRFAIAQEFQRMHREAHGATARRTTHASLESAFDHIKDFRNICAHDERLYSARVDKSQSTDFQRLLQDMRLILTANECECLLADILKILAFADGSIKTVEIGQIVRSMGFSSRAEIAAVLRGLS